MKLTKFQKEAVVRAIMHDVPAPDKSKRHKETQEALVKAMSPECRKVFKATPEVFSDTYEGSLYDSGSWETRRVVKGDAPKGTLEKLVKEYQKADEAYTAANVSLRNAVMSCTTLKMLETMLPEFKKYFPTEAQPTKNLPAIANVVSDLTKLGWPKK